MLKKRVRFSATKHHQQLQTTVTYKFYKCEALICQSYYNIAKALQLAVKLYTPGVFMYNEYMDEQFECIRHKQTRK